MEYICEVSLPLKFNTVCILEEYWHSSKMVFTLNEPIILKDKESILEISLSSPKAEANKRPEPYFILKISNVICKSCMEIPNLISTEVKKICRALTLMGIKGNYNIGRYQPRVEPDYDRIQFSGVKQIQYIEGKIEISEMPLERSLTNINNGFYPAGWLNSVFSQGMPSTLFRHFYDEMDLSDNKQYVAEELYLAQGNESLNSKAFHLFSIIEFIEQQYSKLNESKQIFTKKEFSSVTKAIEKTMKDEGFSSVQIEKVCKCLSNHREVELTNSNHVEKLFKILSNLGIYYISYQDKDWNLTEEFVSEILFYRNKLSHGAENSLPQEKKDRFPSFLTELTCLTLEIFEKV